MKTFIAAIFVVVCYAVVLAQDVSPEKKELVHKFAELTKTDEVSFNVNASFDGLVKSFADTIDNDKELTAAQKADLHATAGAAIERLKTRSKELTETSPEIRQAAIDAAIGVYANAFSEDDLKQLIAFYETPLGQKAVDFLANSHAAVMKALSDKVLAKVGEMIQPMIQAETDALAQKIKDAKAGSK